MEGAKVPDLARDPQLFRDRKCSVTGFEEVAVRAANQWW